MKSGPAQLAAYHLTVLEAQKAGTMHHERIEDPEALERGRANLARILPPEELDTASDELAANCVPATAEGQPEHTRTLDDTPAPREHTPEAPFAPRTRKPRSDAGQPRPRTPKPTPPESAPALTITEVPSPDTIALTFHLPAGESFGLLQYFAQSGRPDESAYIARQIALFHAAL